VWLDGDEETLFVRASRKQNRPLLETKNPRKTFSQILDARRPLYAKIANIRVDTSVLTAEEVAVAILVKLRRINPKPESPIPATAL
jgi:shikimate kinase